MSCSPFDLNEYFLKELSDPQQRQVEAHVQTCPQCREELDRLRLTQAALFSLRDEEIPQRIAFVSDPVFEPSPWQRGWAAFWGSGARLGFAAAAMLSIALIVSAGMRSASTPLSASDVDHRIKAAVAASESRQMEVTRQLVHDVEQHAVTDHNARLIAEDQTKRLLDLQYQAQRSSGEYVTYAGLTQGGYK